MNYYSVCLNIFVTYFVHLSYSAVYVPRPEEVYHQLIIIIFNVNKVFNQWLIIDLSFTYHYNQSVRIMILIMCDS